jgi:hypothetical protein
VLDETPTSTAAAFILRVDLGNGAAPVWLDAQRDRGSAALGPVG